VTLPSRIAGNTVLLVADRLVSLAVGIAIISQVSRYLGVEGFGRFGLVQTFVPAFLVLSDFGISTVLLREIAIHGHDQGRLLGSVTVLRTGLGLASIAACVGVAALLGYRGPLFWAIALYAWSLLLPPLETIGLVFRATVRNEYLVIASLLALLTYAAAAWAAVAMNLGLLGVIAALLTSHMMRTVVTVWSALREVWPRPVVDVDTWGRLICFAAPLGVASLFGTLYGLLDMVFLSKLASTHEMGVYSAASRFGVILSFFPQAFGAVLFPSLSRASADDGALTRLYGQATKVTIILGVLMAGVLWGSAPGIVRLVFGDAFEGTATVLRLLGWQYALVFLNTISGSVLIAIGRQRDNMVLAGIAVSVNAAMLFVLVPAWGATGAAIAVLVTHGALTAMVTVVLWQRAGCLPSRGLLGKTGLALGAMLLVQTWSSVGLIAGPLIYLGLLLVMRGYSLEEIRGLISRPAPAR
jgi:O-antigen/teichoic acid export membrane protein